MTKHLWMVVLVLLAWAAPAWAQQEVDASALFLGTTGTVCKGTAGSAPSSPSTCDWYVNTTDGKLYMRWSSGTWVAAGSVYSVTVTVPTGLTATGCTITTSGTCAISLTSGYMIPNGGGTTGTFLRRNTTPEWSTLVLPNAATQYRIPYATATNVWGDSASLTFTGTRLTTPEAEITAAAALLTGQFGAIEQTAYGATGYKSRWNTGYDGVTWIDAFDSTGGGAWLPMRFRGLSFNFNAPMTFQSTVLAAGAVTAQSWVGSDGYVSETTGWRINPDGAADFQYLTARELKVKIFTADLEQALAGSETIVKSVATLYANFLCPAKGGSGTLLVEDLPGASDMNVFESGDAIVMRTYSRAGGGLVIGDCVGVVTNPSTAPSGYQSWKFTRNAGDNGGNAPTDAIMEAGGVALDYGVSGNGAVVLTAVDGNYGANSPYVGVNTFTTAPVTANFTQRVRLGNLKGITGVTNEYGLMAGNGTWTTAGQYFKASNTGVSLVNVPLDLYASGTKVFSIEPSTPFMAMGSSVPTYTTGAGCWQGFDAGVFKWRCGNPAGQYIDWNGTQLTVNGNIVVTGTSVDAASVNGVAGSTIVSGAQRALLGFTDAGNPILPAPVTTGGAGLYLGSNYMGYYNGSAWRTYMDSSGNFYLGGTSGKLTWNGTTLAIDGIITSTSGTIGGWTLGATTLTGGNAVLTSTGNAAFGTGDNIVRLSADDATYRLWIGNATAASAPFRVTAAGVLTASSVNVSGAITATSGTIGSFTIGTYLYTGSKTAFNDANAGVHIGADGIGIGNNVFTVSSAGALVAQNANITGTITATSGSFTGTVNATGGSFTGNGSGLTSINGGSIQTGTITATQIAAGAITTEKIAAGTVIAVDIVAGSITTDKLATSAVTAEKIAAGAVTAGKIDVDSLSAISAYLGEVTINDDLTMTYGRIIGEQYVLAQNGLEFSNSLDSEASVRWSGGPYINGGSQRLYMRSGGGTWSQMNLDGDGVRFWAAIGGSTAEYIGIDSLGIYAGRSDMQLGQDGYEFQDMWVILNGTTAADYPVVADYDNNGHVQKKTNGVHGGTGCAYVGDLYMERGIVTGYTCAYTPPPLTAIDTRVAALEKEIAELRALLGVRK